MKSSIKKLLAFALSCAVLTGVFAVSASAAEYTEPSPLHYL